MKKSHISKMLTCIHSCVFAGLLLITPFSNMAYGGLVRIDFQASGFGPSNGNTAPNDPVIGMILYEGSIGEISSLVSVSLTLNNYTYSVEDLGFVSPLEDDPLDPLFVIAGTSRGLYSLLNLTNDISLIWDGDGLIPMGFTYTSSTLSGGWSTQNFDYFSFTAIPIPASVWLFGSGLLGLVGMARRKNT